MANYIFYGFYNEFYGYHDIINHFSFKTSIMPFLNELQLAGNVEEADIIIYSVFMSPEQAEILRSIRKTKGKDVKIIQWTGEARISDQDWEYTDMIIGADVPSSNHDGKIFLPFGVLYENCIRDYQEIIPKAPDKRKFCAMFCSYMTPERQTFYDALQKYKAVDGFGRVFSRPIFHRDYWDPRFLEFMSEYKFIICFENTDRPGYNTEKIINPIKAHCIPIYWGSPSINEFINESRFLYLQNMESIPDMIKLISKIDENDQLFNEYINQPGFKENELGIDMRRIILKNASNALNELCVTK